MTRIVFCLMLALFFAMSLGLASADVFTSGPFTTSTPIAFTITDWTGTMDFPKFDPALGYLTQVDVNISSTIRTTLTVTNTSNDSSSGTAMTEVDVTVTDPLSLIMMGSNLMSPNFNFNIGPGQQVTSGLLTRTSSDSQSFTAANILNEFTGPGTITLNAGTYTQTWLTYTGGNTLASQVTDASATGTVTYYYVIPEPAGLALLGPGFLGLVAAIRRRR